MAKEGFVSIHGKEYKTVAKRVQEFRESPTCKNWTVNTDIVKIDDDQVLIKASIADESGRLIATGHGHEFRSASQINKTSYVENAETSAIGRALACLGLGGTEFASANEVQNAIHQQNVPAPQKVTPTAGAGDDLPEDVKQYITDEAIEIIADIEMGNVEAAFDRLNEASKDGTNEINNDYKVFAWSLLPSNVRTAITKHIKSLKG